MENYYDLLLNFIKKYPDTWKENLAKEPYYVTVVQCPFKNQNGNLLYPELYMFSYSQFNSDFNNDIVKACRGCIVSVENKYEPVMVCTPFYKFGNYGESYTDKVDYSSATVYDKIDGMLIKLFNYKGKWIWVTNNGWDIDAKLPDTLESKYFEVESENSKTFIDLIKIGFDRVLTSDYNMNYWLKQFDPKFTYMFELISPKARIICDYPDTELYFLGLRCVKTYKEMDPEKAVKIIPVLSAFKRPFKIYIPFLSDSAVLKYCDSIPDISREGCVVVDKDFKRYKIKCKKYLETKAFKKDTVYSYNQIFEGLKNGDIYDSLAYFPEIENRIERVRSIVKEYYNTILEYCKEAKIQYETLLNKNNNDEKLAKKEFFFYIKESYPNTWYYITEYLKSEKNLLNTVFKHKYCEIEEQLKKGIIK